MKLGRWVGMLGIFLLAFRVSVAAGVYTVNVGPPSGGDDTAVLQAALDDCMTNHPTGCTIQLSAGTYKSTQLFGENFHGTLQGMGMGARIIQALPLLEVTAGPVGEGIFGANPTSPTNKYPMLIIFMAGDITVSDMTFKVTEHDPVVPWCYEWSGCGQTHLYAILGVTGTSANLLVERVGFEGGPGPLEWSGHNYDDALFFFGLSVDQPLTGTFKVVSSRISNGEDSLLVWGVRNAQFTIGGSASDGNAVENGALGGSHMDLDHSVLEYSHNNVTVHNFTGGTAAVFVAQAWLVPLQVPSQFLIQHNTLNAKGSSMDGVWALDLGPPSGLGKTADLVISDNTIQLAGSETDPAWAGVEAVFTVDAVISNNRISGGNAFLGIAAEASSQCMLKANNVQQLQALWAPVGLLGVNSGFPWDTSYCTVVGGNNKTNVYDEGTKNVLVGVNNMQGNAPGPAIKAAMQRKMEMIKSMRKP
jgi:hypothetical protein